MKTLHYAKLGNENIPKLKFKTDKMLYEYLVEIEQENKIYLLTRSGVDSEIFVTDSIECINTYAHFVVNESDDIFLQEYDSFESAYHVAHMMREGHELCYDK
jgi:hypothetical protein